MEFLWLAAGVIYLIYKGIKEEQETMKDIGKCILWLIPLLVIAAIIANNEDFEIFGTILAWIYMIITFILVWIGSRN